MLYKLLVVIVAFFSPPQVSVGLAGTTNKTVKLPKNFTLLGPGLGYTCGPAKVVPSTVYWTPDHRRKTQALSKYLLRCTVIEFLLIIGLYNFY